jgi:uncharacterized protein (DUF58 family)
VIERSSDSGALALQQQAERIAAGLPPLLLRAKRLAATIAGGVHGRRRPGSGEDFWQFRHSQPGDPASAIDWRQSAKSDHLYLRETEWTIAHTTLVWADPSASMRWRSQRDLEQKYDRAALLAVALGFLLEQAGERIGLLGRPGPAFYGRTAPARLALALFNENERSGWPDGAVKRNNNLLLLSDFLQPLPEIAENIRRWTSAGLSGHMLQILDPAEESLPYQGRVRLRGLEDEGDLLLANAESLRDSYHGAMADHRAGLAAIARQAGWRFSLHHTDAPARVALTHLYAQLARG